MVRIWPRSPALKLCQAYRRQYGVDFISAMPTNLYGPGDKFDLRLKPRHAGPVAQNARGRLSAANRRSPIWGTGRPRREFLHVDDCADGVVLLMSHYSGEEHINVGTGQRRHDPRTGRLHRQRRWAIAAQFVYDTSRPDGSPQKRLDVTRLEALGWRAKIDLETGLRETYEWYKTKDEG